MKKLLPALLVSVLLVALLVALTDLQWDVVAGTLAHLDPLLVLLAFLVYAASFVGRGVRLAVLLPGASSVAHLTSISARHILLAVLLPFRSGEASLPLMLSSEAGRTLPEGVSVLGLMRILDLLCVACWLLVGLLLGAPGASAGAGTGAAAASGAAPITGELRLRALAVFGLLALALVLLPWIARRVARLAGSPRRLLAFAGHTAAHVAGMRPARLLAAMLTSLLTWAATYGACWLLLRAMATPGALGAAAGSISFATSLIGTTGLHLSAVIPVSPLAGVGTWEAGWTAGYMLVGMDSGAALASGVASHVLILAFILVLGGAGFCFRRR